MAFRLKALFCWRNAGYAPSYPTFLYTRVLPHFPVHESTGPHSCTRQYTHVGARRFLKPGWDCSRVELHVPSEFRPEIWSKMSYSHHIQCPKIIDLDTVYEPFSIIARKYVDWSAKPSVWDGHICVLQPGDGSLAWKWLSGVLRTRFVTPFETWVLPSSTVSGLKPFSFADFTKVHPSSKSKPRSCLKTKPRFWS